MCPRAAPEPIRVVFVDDDPGLRQLVDILLSWEADIDLVGVSSQGEEAIRMACDLKPDIVITDFRLPDISGTEVGNRISQECPDVQLLLISGFAAADLQEELKMNLFTFVDKRIAFQDFPNLIRRVVG